ncbi:ubiquitin carboxyl-terminal hydrolase-like protein 4 [Dermatophagoides farinae]|uniref:ubiquitinyl hydrolase 1 n=1 Tax=Dermatophagoides farinae TaxID=6954 RepID=A0A9D4P213_DERFA|nr:ubiquitin carboxyl-terminal hydrolase-like protein 4 [Dermatophagoides farinae]
MEFFDSTGISNEEAQALDVIKYESSGIEFLLNYNTHRLGQIISNNNNNFINTQSAGAAAPHGHPPHPYIFGAAHPAYYPHPPPPPPNHPYAIHTLPLGASQQPVHPTAAAAASVNQQHQRMPTMQNIGVHSSSNNKNSKNPSNVNSSPICDIRNSSNIYMSPQYSDATRQIIDVNQRLKNASVTGDQSGGNISDQILVSNGGSTATVAMPAHHLSSYANPYAFQPHALSFPHHFPHQPFYYVTSESFLQYQSIQPPQTHISPIPPVAHLINTSSSMNIPLTSTNQPPQLPASSSSSIPSAAMVTTTISSSSISTSSISSTSTTPYQNNTSGQETTLQKNRPMSTSDDKNSMIDQNVPSQSTIQDEVIKTNQNVSEKSSPETTDVNQASDYLKLCLNISDSSGKDDDNTTITKDSDQIETPAVIQNNNTVAANTELESITDDAAAEQFTNNKQSDPSSNKPTTWASRLFPTSITTGLNNIENQMANSNNNDGEESKVNVIHDISTTNSFVVTVSSELKSPSLQPNGDFPELNVIIKNHHSSNRRSGRSSNVHHDDNNLKNMTVIPIKNDPIAFKLAKRLRDNIHLKHSLPTIMPRGLINRGNWCYVNATMQALLACPPFYNLMREISETPGLFRQSTSTPIIDNFARYFVKFLPTDYKRQMKNVGNSYLEELLNTDPFEPTFIYDTLKHCGMIKNDAQRGHQEDAEEFLSSVLNGLNEEMIHLSKLLEETNDKISSVDKTNGFGLSNKSTSFDFELDDQLGLCHDVDDDDGVQDSSNDIWHEVGTTKHRSLPTRSAKIFSTSITEIFGGSTLDIRTVNKDKDSCGNRQPFFTLQLDIKPSSIKTLDDAIRWQTKSETIHGYTCSKTKQIVDASSQMFLENLPPILILHLKLFDYEIETGASKKLLKTIDFHENFEIPRECVTGKIDHRCRRYKLLAVVYHNGTEVINGHYITDVYHLGLNQWLRCDDSNIKVISLSKVLTGTEREGNLVPYLLFYRRYDTLHSNNSSSSSSSANNNNNNSVQPNNSGSKRSINSHTGNEFGHNHNHHHHHHHHHHHNNDQQSNKHQDLMLANNKFSSISRQQY